MSRKKWNQIRQARIKEAGQPDFKELVELGQLIREQFPNVKVQREWYIVFGYDGSYLRVQEQMPKACKYRHPDLMVFEKLEGNRMGKLLCCVEVDGSVHDFKSLSNTNKRNAEYEAAKIPLCVITKSLSERNIYDQALTFIRDILCQK